MFLLLWYFVIFDLLATYLKNLEIAKNKVKNAEKNGHFDKNN